WVRVLIYQCIEMWLCKLWFITFVMPVTAITNHVNEDVFVEFLPVSNSQCACFNYSFGVVSVYVQHRTLQHGCNTGTVVRRTRVIKISSKAYLVIDYKMYDATYFITFEFAHLQQLINNALSCNSSIAV